MGEQERRSLVYAFGFAKAGFSVPAKPVPVGTVDIEWLPYDSPRSLDSANGVVVPQGIFEVITYGRNWMGESTVSVTSDHARMVEREHQILKLVREGGWICFLVGPMRPNTLDTDLPKRLLSIIGGIRYTISDTGISWATPLTDEFRQYMDRFGVTHTKFEVDTKHRAVVLAKAGHLIVGLEVNRACFFLPFHATSRDEKTSQELATAVAIAVTSYRRRRMVEPPAWADDFRFAREERSLERERALEAELAAVQTDIEHWKRYKAILSTTGPALNRLVCEILSEYFGLNVDPTDEGREDFKILVDERVRVVGESKGTNKGIRREQINQVDTNRERSGLGHDIAGLLVINNEMEILSIEKRLLTTVSADHVPHATRHNVTITRTVDLLFLMRHLEHREDRGAELLALLSMGGGWLRADKHGYALEPSR